MSGLALGKPLGVAQIGKRKLFLRLLRGYQPQQFLPVAAGGQPVGDIAFCGQAVQFDPVYLAAPVRQFAGHLHGMGPSRSVVVGEDGNFGAGGKTPGAREGPFPRAAMVSRGRQAERGQRVGIFFALDHKDRLARRQSGQQFRQPVRQGFAIAQIPEPAAGSGWVRPPEAKTFRDQPHDLVAQAARFVAVIVGRGDSQRFTASPRRRAGVRQRLTSQLGQFFQAAAEVFLMAEENSLGGVDRKRWIAVAAAVRRQRTVAGSFRAAPADWSADRLQPDARVHFAASGNRPRQVSTRTPFSYSRAST